MQDEILEDCRQMLARAGTPRHHPIINGLFAARILWALLLVVLIAGSLLPESTKRTIGTHTTWHWPLHFFVFAVLCALTQIAFRWRVVIGSTFALAGLGVLLELAEHLVYNSCG